MTENVQVPAGSQPYSTIIFTVPFNRDDDDDDGGGSGGNGRVLGKSICMCTLDCSVSQRVLNEMQCRAEDEDDEKEKAVEKRALMKIIK